MTSLPLFLLAQLDALKGKAKAKGIPYLSALLKDQLLKIRLRDHVVMVPYGYTQHGVSFVG